MSGDSLVIIVNQAPYLGERACPPEGTPNLEELLKRALDMGAEVKVCGTCIDTRGFEPGKEEFGICFIGKRDGALTFGDLIKGVEMGSMMDLTDWIMNNDKTVSF
jgi:sulfur relay (sulfurtransferase) complex TusBCD TusD component (DsrE family)